MDIRTVFLLRVSSSVDKDVDHPQFFDPPYALKYLQAGLQNYDRVKVHFLDCWIYPMSISSILEHVVAARPDLLVVSSSSFDTDVADVLVRSLRKEQTRPVIIGIGQGYYRHSSFEQGSDGEYDAVLLGEPEEEFFRMFDQLLQASSDNQGWREYYRTHFLEQKPFIVEHLDRLPFPSYTPEELRAYKSIYPVRLSRRAVWGFLIATRGCRHKCTFCSEVMRVSIGKKIRSRSVAGVADEMEHLGSLGVTICSFQDDSFSASRSFVKALCEELIERKAAMPWMARARVDEVDYELLSLMKRAGCIMLGLGVESGSQRIIEDMHKQWKPKPWPQLCRQVFRWTAELGIGTNAYYVIGNPTETRDEIEQTISLAMELNSDSIQVHFYTPYPGSVAWEKYRDIIERYDPRKMFHYASPMFSLADVSVEELVKLRSQFYRRYIFRFGFAVHHLWSHLGFYLRNPDVFRTLVGIRKIF